MANPVFKSGVTAISGPQNLTELIRVFTELINIALPIIGALAILVFFKGLVAFIYKAGDAKSHTEGKNLMIWGLIALFVIISYLGIIGFLSKEFGFGSNIVFPLLPENK